MFIVFLIASDYCEVMESEKALCEICGKVFKLSKTLNRHLKRCHDMEIHLTSDKEMCIICDKMFSNAAALDRHTKTHYPTSERVGRKHYESILFIGYETVVFASEVVCFLK